MKDVHQFVVLPYSLVLALYQGACSSLALLRQHELSNIGYLDDLLLEAYSPSTLETSLVNHHLYLGGFWLDVEHQEVFIYFFLSSILFSPSKWFHMLNSTYEFLAHDTDNRTSLFHHWTGISKFSLQVKAFLVWWLFSLLMLTGRLLLSPCWKIVTIDAGLLGFWRDDKSTLGAEPLVQRGILVASPCLGVVGD